MTYERRLLKILKNKFGHSDYKNLMQKQAAELIYKGKNDVCLYMPSGFGKSLCYQLPILAKDKCFAIVISPSIAHAKNQVDYLKSIGVTAYMWNGYSCKAWIKNNVIPNMYSQKHKMKILYVTAEIFITSHFQFLLTNINPNVLAYFVVDEAHCVSSSSHDYKESYQELKIMRKRYPSIPIVAVTATANDKVKSDIVEILRMNSKVTFSMPMTRSNLYFDVHCIDNINNPIDHLKLFIEKSLGSTSEDNRNCGLIFCQNHDAIENLTRKLSSLGLSVLAYSKRSKIKERHKVQNLWTSGEIKILITTSCFGKGVSKQSVRFVVHWSTPLSIGHCYQEIGRAGHDGLKSYCRIYYKLSEINPTYEAIQNECDLNCIRKITYKTIIKKSFAEIKESFKKLECRHIVMYKYFDEAVAACKNHCDVCKNQFHIERPIKPVNKCEQKLHLKRKNKNSFRDEKIKRECIVLSDGDEYENKNSDFCVTSGNYALSAKKQLKKIKRLLYIKVKTKTDIKKIDCITLSDNNNSIIVLD